MRLEMPAGRPRGRSTLAGDVIARLHETYRAQPQIGLVLGAGVTVGSGVPGYAELALRLFERADQARLLRGAPGGARRYLANLRREDTGRGPRAFEPEEIVEFVRAFFVGDAAQFSALVREALYGEGIKTGVRKMVPASIYRENATLDAVISFCAARPGAPHAGPTGSGRVAVNRRVGAILTTNYDNLVEGSFGSKYRKQGLLRPVGRPPGSDEPGPIPVYHCHGYLSYASGSASSGLLIAEHDYFGAFYDQLGFGNIVATNFFRRWPGLFIGSSMADRNIRRVLYQTRLEGMGAASHLEHFAILPRSRSTNDPGDARAREDADALEDAILTAYGVSVIRVGELSEIREILRGLYLSPDDVHDAEWDWAERARTRSTPRPSTS